MVDFGGVPESGVLRCLESYGTIFPTSRAAVVLSKPTFAATQPDSGLKPLTAISGSIHLYNRSELFRTLSLKNSDEYSNSQLVLAAYEKWGEKLGESLLGDFSFVIWDDLRMQLLCCRDHFGVEPFFYTFSSHRLIFGSDPRILLSTPGVVRSLNYRKFASTVVHNGHLSVPDETFHQGILSLPGGTSMVLNSGGLRKFRYWQPEIRPETIPSKPQDAFTALRELVFDAINGRLPDGEATAAVLLSGGLDSSSIASVAAKCMERRGRGRVLMLAGVLPEPKPEGVSDEREFIDRFRGWPAIEIVYVSAPGKGPFDDIHEPQNFEATPLVNPFTYLQMALAEAGIANGASVRMNGMFGEFGPTTRGERYLAELLLTLRLPSLKTEAIALRNRGIDPFAYLMARFKAIVRSELSFVKDPFVLIAPAFRRYGKPRRRPTFRWPSQRGLQTSQLDFVRMKHADSYSRPAERLLRTTFPWLDKRIMEFCIAAPSGLKMSNGYERYLLRGALDGILPPEIQWRTSKAPFSPDYLYRYNAQLASARDFVAQIGASDPIREVIDVDQLNQLLVPVDPTKVSKIAIGAVPATIYAICFLRQFAEFS